MKKNLWMKRALCLFLSVVVSLGATENILSQRMIVTEAKCSSCTHHHWKNIYGIKKVVAGMKEVWVVDQEAYDEDEIGTEGYAVRCKDCGREFANYDDYVEFVKERGAAGDYAHGCYEVLLHFTVVGTIHHDEVGHWETRRTYKTKKYVKYKKCTKCGRRKKVSR